MDKNKSTNLSFAWNIGYVNELRIKLIGQSEIVMLAMMQNQTGMNNLVKQTVWDVIKM